ncbi:phosphotransferase [Nonomuraea ceibae]|uniref:phosphotransferase n=1 Tax=Nonomuraea ceibae TaxID=1935170 RepID=UPI001C60406B
MRGPAPASGPSRQVDDLRRHLPPGLWAIARAPLQRAIERYPARPRVLCHGDLHPNNVLMPAQPGGRRVAHLTDSSRPRSPRPSTTWRRPSSPPTCSISTARPSSWPPTRRACRALCWPT